MHRETTGQFCSLVEAYYKERFVEVKATEITIQTDLPIFKVDTKSKQDSFQAFPIMTPRRM